jgi:hypothetical protein
MQAAELIALKHNMEVVMSSVFKANMPARLLDQKMKYQMYSTSLELSPEQALEAIDETLDKCLIRSRNRRRKA